MRQSIPLWYDVRTGRQTHAKNRGAAAKALGAPLRAVQQAGYTAVPSKPAVKREDARTRQRKRSAVPTYLFAYLMLREAFPAERLGLATKPLRDFLGDMRGALECLAGVERRALQRRMDAQVALWRAQAAGQDTSQLRRDYDNARNNRPCRRAIATLERALDGCLPDQEAAVEQFINEKRASGWFDEEDLQNLEDWISAVWIPRGWR
jgi:hypothetical protein